MDSLPCKYHDPDIWIVILGHVDCGSDYKSVCLVDHLRKAAVKKAHPNADTKFANHLLTLLTMIHQGKYQPSYFHLGRTYPKDPWEIDITITNPNITPEIIDAHPEWHDLWDWGYLTDNPNITTQWLETLNKEYLGLRQGTGIVNASNNPCVTIDYVIDHPEIIWHWESLSENPSMTDEVIAANPNLPWELDGLVRNPSVTWVTLSKYDYFDRYQMCELSESRITTLDTVRGRPDLSWERYHLTINPNITLAIIKANPDIPWDIAAITRNPNITIDGVIANPKIPWIWPALTRNANMTLAVIKAHPEFPWCLSHACGNPSITWADVEAHPDGIHGQSWDLSSMGGKPNLTWKKIIELDAIAKWDWYLIAEN